MIELIQIPDGTFLMGSPETEERRYRDEEPQHLVTVSSFLIGKYPVTQAEWRFVAGLPQINRELNPDPSHFKGDRLPVECVSWFEAVEFCDRLSAHTGHTYRLPSENEWEYACRAGTTTAYSFGDRISREDANLGSTETIEVGQYSPNAFGLHDMHGNVWEWCLDDWHDSYQGAPVHRGAWIGGGDRKVLRGGSWGNSPGPCRSAFRHSCDPGDDDSIIGFRVVCEVPGTV